MVLGEVVEMVQDEVVDSGADAPNGATNPGAAALLDTVLGEVVVIVQNKVVGPGADAPDGATGLGANALPVQLARAHTAAAAVVGGRGGVPQRPTFASDLSGPQHEVANSGTDVPDGATAAFAPAPPAAHKAASSGADDPDGATGSGAAGFAPAPPAAPVTGAHLAGRASRQGQLSRTHLFAHVRFDTSRWVTPAWTVGACDVDDHCVREEPQALAGRSGAAALTPEAGTKISHPAVAGTAPTVAGAHTVATAPTAGRGASMSPAAGGVPAGAIARTGFGARVGRAGARRAAPVGAPADTAPPPMGGAQERLSAPPRRPRSARTATQSTAGRRHIRR